MAMTERAGIPYGPRWRERRPGQVPRALIIREGEQALLKELARLRRELAVEFPDRLRQALSFGEAHRNDDYLQIKEEEAVVASRIRRLETVLMAAQIVEHNRALRGEPR
jgi:transcription elongation GreA/GreB family factor